MNVGAIALDGLKETGGRAVSSSITIIADSTIECPGCGGNYLHQGKVEVFDRGEDQPNRGIAIINGGAFPTTEGKNPSSRRQGMLIYFDCENCNSFPILAIFQHKGQTFIEWSDFFIAQS